MSDDYSDQQLSRIQAQVDGWYHQFQNTPEFEKLTKDHQERSSAVISLFSEFAYSYLGMRPQAWDRSAVDECCTEIMPRKVSDEPLFFEAISPVLTAFFRFLGDRSLLRNGHALADAAARLDQEIVENSEDSSRWGPAKSFIMGAMEEGIDITDPATMNAYVAKVNGRMAAQFAARQATLWTAGTPPMPNQARRSAGPSVGRYDPCPCGSGKKYKFCCEARLRNAT